MNKSKNTLTLFIQRFILVLAIYQLVRVGFYFYNQSFFPEINTEKTKANAKRKLREYPRWRRVANDVDGQKVTAVYTFEPRQTSGNPSRPVERLAINRVDAEAELEAIEYAINNLLNLSDNSFS